MAGALGLAADQPFFVSASASGTISRGQFQATSRSGALVPLEGSGAWTPAGGSGQGQVTLAASRWLIGYQKMLGPQASFPDRRRQGAGRLLRPDADRDLRQRSI